MSPSLPLRLVTLLAVWAMCGIVQAQDWVHPLAPPDRSSPRAALTTFLESCDTAAAFLATEYMNAPTRSGFHRMRELFRTPIETLDLSEVPAASRGKFATTAANEIYEVLCRIELPPLDQIPGGDSPETAGLGQWAVPNTELTLVRGADGQFRFSPETVRRADEFYARVKHLPYARAVPLEQTRQLPVEGGGWLVPLKWIRGMPGWLLAPIAGQSVWKWLALCVVIVLLAPFFWAAMHLSRRGGPDRPVLRAVAGLSLPVSILVATPVVAYIVLVQINFTGGAGATSLLMSSATMSLVGAWLAWRAAPVFAEAIIALPHIATESINAHVIRIVARLFGIAVGVALLVSGADRLGLPVYGIVAGLGIGGLALALAAQPTIENLIGGLSLFADKPVKVGDFGRYGENTGTIEAIGIRSTRIRGTDRTLTSIPNSALARLPIVNFSERDRILIQVVFGVRSETTSARHREVLAALREMLAADPRIYAETARVRFVGFGEGSLQIEVFVYVRTRDWNEFLGIREEIYLDIMDVIEQHGASLAVPARMLHFAGDRGLNSHGGEESETQVARVIREGTQSGPRPPAGGRPQRVGAPDLPTGS